MRKLLWVDEDQAGIASLEAELRAEGFTVVVARDVETARDLFLREGFDGVIADLSLAEFRGIHLSHWVRRQKEVPILLTAPYTGLGEGTQEARAFGADAFLRKPFRAEELAQAIRRELLRREGGRTLQDADFCSMRLDPILARLDSLGEAQASVHMKLPSGRFVKIAHRLADLAPERVRSYRDKGIERVLIPREEMVRCAEGAVLALRAELGGPADGDRPRLLRASCEAILENLFVADFDSRSYEFVKALADAIVEHVRTQFDAMEDLTALAEGGLDFASHSLAVSLVSARIACEFPWASPVVRHQVALGALLHDIGMKGLPLDWLKKRECELTPREARLVRLHPLEGLKRLRKLSSVPEAVRQIVSQHHEGPRGTGYPAGLRGDSIQPLARIVGVGSWFCTFVLSGFISGDDVAVQLLKDRVSDPADRVHREATVALLKVLSTFRRPRELTK